MFLRIYHPEVFQGNLRKKHYFEGWYFKHVTGEPDCAVSFIPGVSLAGNDSHAFIQINNSYTGRSDYVRYPLSEFKWDNKSLDLTIGTSRFTTNYIIINIRDGDINMNGRIDYSNMIKYPGSLLSPGIMGWYSFMPFMECYHGIVSVNHELSGIIISSGTKFNFSKGNGYIEKDWGTSFPESWLWIQSNNFAETGTSFSFSVAKIPWLGKFFIGFISFLYFDKRFYMFSTYNRSVVTELTRMSDSISVTVKNRDFTLNIRVFKNSFGVLKAPVSGEMSRSIKESIDSEVHLKLSDKSNKVEYEGTGKHVGLEIIEKIFDYF